MEGFKIQIRWLYLHEGFFNDVKSDETRDLINVLIVKGIIEVTCPGVNQGEQS